LLLKDYVYQGENSQKNRLLSIFYGTFRRFGRIMNFFVAKTLQRHYAVIAFKINI